MNAVWHGLLYFFNQKFLLTCIHEMPGKSAKNALVDWLRIELFISSSIIIITNTSSCILAEFNFMDISIQRARHLGISFMVLFSAFTSAQNMMVQIYKQQGYEEISIWALFCLYTFFGLGYFIS